MSKICKNDTKLNRKEQKNPIKKWAEDQNRYFFQRRYTNGQQGQEKVLNTPLNIREYKSKPQ